jgi:hypothetical protein
MFTQGQECGGHDLLSQRLDLRKSSRGLTAIGQNRGRLCFRYKYYRISNFLYSKASGVFKVLGLLYAARREQSHHSAALKCTVT